MKRVISEGNGMSVKTKNGNHKSINILLEEEINTIRIKEVKIIGKVQGEKNDVEISMSKKLFFEWINKIKHGSLHRETAVQGGKN